MEGDAWLQAAVWLDALAGAEAEFVGQGESRWLYCADANESEERQGSVEITYTRTKTQTYTRDRLQPSFVRCGEGSTC